MDLLKLAKQSKNVLKPFGETEVLLFYGIVAKSLKKYLRGKELAAKNWLPLRGGLPYLIKRGSKEEPLYINDFIEAITPQFLETRKEIKALKDAKKRLTKTQQNVWLYFLPRKLSDFFYATNSESAGKSIDRIFLDIDRKDVSEEKAKHVSSLLVDTIRDDKDFNALISYKTFVYWTGSSFHVMLMLKNKRPASFYKKHFEYNKHKPLESFTGRWAEKISKSSGLRVMGGHEKLRGYINIDPSQTPSGKLCRVPLGSLHMKRVSGTATVDGVSIPLEPKMPNNEALVRELRSYTPEKVIRDLKKLEKRLPC